MLHDTNTSCVIVFQALWQQLGKDLLTGVMVQKHLELYFLPLLLSVHLANQ